MYTVSGRTSQVFACADATRSMARHPWLSGDAATSCSLIHYIMWLVALDLPFARNHRPARLHESCNRRRAILRQGEPRTLSLRWSDRTSLDEDGGLRVAQIHAGDW